MDLCATCKTKVEDGAVRCSSCGADLFLPGAFVQLVGWVMIGVAVIPFSISLRTVEEGEYLPLIIGALILLSGALVVVITRLRNARAPSRVIRQNHATDKEHMS